MYPATDIEHSDFVKPLHDMATSDPLGALGAIGRVRAVLDDAEALAVVAARRQRSTWGQIAEMAGIPMRTAHRHFRHLEAEGDGLRSA